MCLKFFIFAFIILITNFIMDKIVSEKLLNIYRHKLKVTNCPYCNSTLFKKHGKYKYTQRYKCKVCNKTFIPSSGTSIHYLHKKDIFIEYAESLRKDGIHSIMKTSKKFGIARLTAFDWRHKILSSIPNNEAIISGDIILYDLWFLFSEKGRPVTVNFNRNTKDYEQIKDFTVKMITLKDRSFFDGKITKIGEIKLKDFNKVIGNKVKAANSFLIPEDGDLKSLSKNLAYKIQFFQKDNKPEKYSETIEQFYKVCKDLKKWIRLKFRGVSTKYLQLYINFFKMQYFRRIDFFSRKIIGRRFIWKIFTQMELTYANFIKHSSKINYSEVVKRKWKRTLWYYLPVPEFNLPY